MEKGQITSVNHTEGGTICNVQGARFDTEYKEVPVMQPSSGMTSPPEQGEAVLLSEALNGERYIIGSISRLPEPPDLENGDFAVYLDKDTKIVAKEKSDGVDLTVSASDNLTVNASSDLTVNASGNLTVNASSDLTVSASGDLTINAGGSVSIEDIDFDEHTHSIPSDDSHTTNGPE